MRAPPQHALTLITKAEPKPSCAPLLLIATLSLLFMFKFQEIKNSIKKKKHKTNRNDLHLTKTKNEFAELINSARPRSLGVNRRDEKPPEFE